MGVPAARAAHATLEIGGANYGLYTLVESVDGRFLKRWFRSAEGPLYELGGVEFVTDQIDRFDHDGGPDDTRGLTAIANALAVPGVRGFHAFRARRLGDRLEVDFHLQVDPACSTREGHAIAGQVKAEILSTHPEVLSVLVHVEPDEAANLHSRGYSGRLGT
jgi:hypothetical protein